MVQTSILREYLQVLLLEGAWDDAIKKMEQSPDPQQRRTKEFSEYKRLGIHPKFVPVFIRTPNAYWNSPEIWKEITREWDEIAKRNLKGFEKDVTKYVDAFALTDAVDQSKNLVSNTQAKAKAKSGSKTLFSQDGWKVISVQTKEASCAYGTGTKWCISATQSQNHFDAYDQEQKVNFYFVIKGDAKFAIAVYPQEIEGKTREYFDAQDNPLSEEQFREELENLGAPDGVYQVVGVKPEHGELDPTKSQVRQRPLLIDTDPVEWLRTTDSVPGMAGNTDSVLFPTSKFFKALPALVDHLRTNANPETHDLERFQYYIRKLLGKNNAKHFSLEDTTRFLGFLANQRTTPGAILPPGKIQDADMEWLRWVQNIKDPRHKILETLDQYPEERDDTYTESVIYNDPGLMKRMIREYLDDPPAGLSEETENRVIATMEHGWENFGLSKEDLLTLFARNRRFGFAVARSLDIDQGTVYSAMWGALGSLGIPSAPPEELQRVHEIIKRLGRFPENDPWLRRDKEAQWQSVDEQRWTAAEFWDGLAAHGYNIWDWLADKGLEKTT